MQRLLVFQSLWGMQGLRGEPVQPPLEASLERIAAAGFDGVSAHYFEPAAVAQLAPLLASRRLTVEGQVFPRTLDELRPALALAQQYGVHHLTVQADVRPRDFSESRRLLEGWSRLAEDAGVPVYFETHRGRLTNDLLQMLDLLDALPELKLTADLSHYVVAREFELPLAPEMAAQIARLFGHAWAIHGRVAGSGQVQLELGFAQHRPWLEVFLDWWRRLMRDWRQRADADASLAFTCELGPQPYAISGADGMDLSDRWQDALRLRELALDCWREA